MTDRTTPSEKCSANVFSNKADAVKRRAVSRFRLAGTTAMLAALMGGAGGAWAQSATPASTIEVDVIVVEGRRLTQEEISRDKVEAIPGGTGLIVNADLEGRANLTLSDALATAPGVIVQNFFGGNDQPRVQVRGSGLQQNPVERGIVVLQNGLPINRADGSYIVGFTDPRQAVATEIYRGYTANRLGATVLGGAINYISPTGSANPGGEIGVEGGSFETINATGRVGLAGEGVDGLLQVSYGQRDGYRVYNSSERVSIDGNIGFNLSDEISTRIFVGYTDLSFDIAGPLPKSVLETDPRNVHPGPTFVPGMPPSLQFPGPNVLRDLPGRDADQIRIGQRTTGDFGAHVVDFALGYTYTDDTFTFPVSAGVRETDGGDVNAVLRYAYDPNEGTALPLFEATANYVFGSADRRNFTNIGGEKGPQFGANDLEASTLSFSATLNLPLGDYLMLSPAIAYARATRDNEDVFGAPTRPTISFSPVNQTARLPDGAVPFVDTSYERDYDGFSPSLALSYRPASDHLLFAAVSRSFEPPTHDDLLATVGGTPFSSAGRPQPPNPTFPAAAFATPDLDAQTATTVEGGWRGRGGVLTWDAVVYYAWVEDELLSLRDTSGAQLAAVNANKTRHFGVEVGASAALTDSLSMRVAYTYQDFAFRDDPVRGDNKIAGAPPHTLNAMAGYDLTDAFRVQTEVQWSPEETPVDNLNTLFNDPYVVVDLRAAYDFGDVVTVYGDIRNLFDENYAGSTLIVDRVRQDQSAFLPGEGRAFYGGVKVRF
ncbi:MAG: TonB-dependent receptor [Pseudomonadota bacterium]